MCVTIRSAQLEDATAVADLLPDLGYSAKVHEVRIRLSEVLASPHHAIFLSLADELVVGLCLIGSVRHIASSGFAEVFELVVRTSFQRQGIGRLLLRHAQEWATMQGHSRLRLRSGVQRTDAHQFYERLGYSKSRASFAFEISLDRSEV